MTQVLRFTLVAALILLLPGCTPPEPNRHVSTDLYAVELVVEEGVLNAGRLRNLTRRPGYDDQPQFLPDDRILLYSSRLENDQVDTFRFDLGTAGRTRLTNSAESEYSPLMLPGGGGFSAVRLEQDGAQRLWRFDLTGGTPTLLLEREGLIGYYTWADARNVALCILGDQDEDPNRLELVDVETGQGRFIELEGSLGRCLQPVPGRRAVSFVDEISADEWWIKELDLDTLEVRRLTRTLPGIEHFSWTPWASLIAGQGSALYEWRPDTSGEATSSQWRPFADFAVVGLVNLTRLTINSEGSLLVMVGEKRRSALDRD